MSEEKKLNGTVIVTYRCNARCSMCNRYKAPSKPEEEISIETIKKLLCREAVANSMPISSEILYRGTFQAGRGNQHRNHQEAAEDVLYQYHRRRAVHPY